MSEIIKIAFRNLFRNPRRSLLTVFISALSVFILVFGGSFLGGMFGNILNEGIKFTGHVRLTQPERDLNERMMSLGGNTPDYSRMKAIIQRAPGVQTVTGRIRFASLIYKGDSSKEGLGYGIEPADLKILGFQSIIYQGRILAPGQSGEIIIGRELAASLKLAIGDQVTLIARTLYNSPWALNYRVVGFYDLQNGRLNKSFYISLPDAQELLDMADRVTEILVFGASKDETNRLIIQLKKVQELKGFLLKRWDEIGLGPAFTQIVVIVSTIIRLIFLILAGLGIANTMFMAVFERKSEIGLLKSMGMRNEEIVALFTVEGTFLGILGTGLGLVSGGVGAYILATQGIRFGGALNGLPLIIGNVVYGDFNSAIFLTGGILGLATAIVASFLPIMSGVRLKPTEALRK